MYYIHFLCSKDHYTAVWRSTVLLQFLGLNVCFVHTHSIPMWFRLLSSSQCGLYTLCALAVHWRLPAVGLQTSVIVVDHWGSHVYVWLWFVCRVCEWDRCDPSPPLSRSWGQSQCGCPELRQECHYWENMLVSVTCTSYTPCVVVCFVLCMRGLFIHTAHRAIHTMKYFHTLQKVCLHL